MEKEVLTIDEKQHYEEEITKLKNIILLQKSEIEYWKNMSNLARKEKYAIKAEASQGEQLSLFDDVELLSEIENTKEKIEEINSIKVEGYTRKKSKNVVNIENVNLPIEVIDVKLDEEGLTEIGSPEIVRRLHVIPRQFFIREYHIHKYLKNTEAGKTIVITGKNDEYYNPLGKEMVTPSVVSMIACDKVINSLPLYRQEKQLKTEGMDFQDIVLAII